MFKVLILQKYHGLSDGATEEQIADRLSFLHFLGLELEDDIPDAKAIWVFKERIEESDRGGSRRLFEAFTTTLEKKNLIAREGCIIDASFTEARRQRNTRSQNQQIKGGQRPEAFDANKSVGAQRDIGARWIKKNNQSYYGYKNHAKVDLKSKLIIKSETAAASVHDSQVFKQLLDKKDQAVLADSAYYSEENEEYVLGVIDADELLMRKANRNSPLSEKEIKTNSNISRMRVRVEHVFGRMAHMRADICRSIGLKRAKSHNHLCNLTIQYGSLRPIG